MSVEYDDLSQAGREAHDAFNRDVFIPRVLGMDARHAGQGVNAQLSGTERTGVQSFGGQLPDSQHRR